MHPAQILSKLHLAAYIYGYRIGDVPGDGDCAIHSVLACMPHLTDGVSRVRQRIVERLLPTCVSRLRWPPECTACASLVSARKTLLLLPRASYGKTSRPTDRRVPNGGAWVDHAALVALTRV